MDPVIKVDKIKIKSLLMIDGYRYYLAGKTGNRIRLTNAEQLYLSNKWMQYVRRIEKFLESNGIRENLVSAECNIEFYKLLVNKHTQQIFSKKFNAIGAKIDSNIDRFSELDVSKQCEALMNIIRLTTRTNQGVDLTAIGETKTAGSSKASMKITDHSVVLINQSVTGLYESRMDVHAL